MRPFNPLNPGYFTTDDLLKFGFKSVGTNVKIAKNATVIGVKNITLGNNIRIDGGTTLAAFSGFLEIGSYVHISANCFLSCAGGVTLSSFCGLSQGVKIFSASDDYSGDHLTNPTIPSEFTNVLFAPVVIGRHVIIGTGSVVLPGVNIGYGSAIGALSLVNKSLKEWGIYSGVPAALIKARKKGLLRLEDKLLASLTKI